jgi:putative endonuclease
MNEYVVYILYSEKHHKFYRGYTSHLIERFKSHQYIATKGYTIKYRPWKVVYVEFCNSKKEAIAREKFLKSGLGRQWVQDLIIL